MAQNSVLLWQGGWRFGFVVVNEAEKKQLWWRVEEEQEDKTKHKAGGAECSVCVAI